MRSFLTDDVQLERFTFGCIIYDGMPTLQIKSVEQIEDDIQIITKAEFEKFNQKLKEKEKTSDKESEQNVKNGV